MTSTQDPMAAYAELVGPGGPFELVEEDVRGIRLPVYRNRARALHEILAGSVEHGERTYIATANEQVSFAEHAVRVSSLARALTEQHGVTKGDRVVISGANTIEWIETFWAVVSLGAVAVAFNAWWSEKEVEHALALTTPTLALADAKRSASLRDHGVTVLSLEDDVPVLRSAHPDAPLPSADVAEDDPAALIFTSGTSGRPKAATHSHRNLLAVVEYHRMNDALLTAFGNPMDPRDRSYLLASPLFHIASLHNLVVPRLATGSKVALHLGSFDVERIYALIEKEKVTNWGAVPTMASRMLDVDPSGYDLSSLTAFSLASAPSSEGLKKKLRETLPFATALVDSYGMTETSTGVAVATPADLAESPGTLGRPTYGVQVEVRDPLDNTLGPGEEGEVCVRSCYNMLGYWENEEATAATIREDGWLHTGDLGELDEQGRLRLSSRRSDLIIRGGENVYPVEVENVLTEHPAVVECMVFGVAHEDLGQEVGVVVVHGDDEPSVDELKEFVKQELAYYKVPAHWRLTTTPLVRNATGKVVRAAVLASA